MVIFRILKFSGHIDHDFDIQVENYYPIPQFGDIVEINEVLLIEHPKESFKNMREAKIMYGNYRVSRVFDNGDGNTVELTMEDGQEYSDVPLQ